MYLRVFAYTLYYKISVDRIFLELVKNRVITKSMLKEAVYNKALLHFKTNGSWFNTTWQTISPFCEMHAFLLALKFSMKSLDPLLLFIIGVACKELVRRRTNLVCTTSCQFSRIWFYFTKAFKWTLNFKYFCIEILPLRLIGNCSTEEKKYWPL